jgi:hypothetical protein
MPYTIVPDRKYTNIILVHLYIDKALNQFAVDTNCGLESNFDKEKEVILHQQREITSKIADLKHSQHQIESILDIKIESNIQFFLFRNKAKEQIQQNLLVITWHLVVEE